MEAANAQVLACIQAQGGPQVRWTPTVHVRVRVDLMHVLRAGMGLFLLDCSLYRVLPMQRTVVCCPVLCVISITSACGGYVQGALESPEALAQLGSLLDCRVEDLRSDLAGVIGQVVAAINAATDVGPHKCVFVRRARLR